MLLADDQHPGIGALQGRDPRLTLRPLSPRLGELRVELVQRLGRDGRVAIERQAGLLSEFRRIALGRLDFLPELRDAALDQVGRSLVGVRPGPELILDIEFGDGVDDLLGLRRVGGVR